MDTLTTLVPEVATNNIGNIAAFSLIIKFLVDGIRYFASEVIGKEITVDAKIVAGTCIFVILMFVNRDTVASLTDVTELAGEALALTATTWASHQVIKPKN